MTGGAAGVISRRRIFGGFVVFQSLGASAELPGMPVDGCRAGAVEMVAAVDEVTCLIR